MVLTPMLARTRSFRHQVLLFKHHYGYPKAKEMDNVGKIGLICKKPLPKAFFIWQYAVFSKLL